MIFLNDADVCPWCGAYYQDNGYCVNGHVREKKFTEKCGECVYLQSTVDRLSGQCKCSMSKYFYDIMNFEDCCECFLRKNS